MPQGSKWVEWSCIPISPEKLDLYHHPGILLTAFHLALKSVSVLTINYMILLYIRGVQGKLLPELTVFQVSLAQNNQYIKVTFWGEVACYKLSLWSSMALQINHRNASREL